MYATIIKSELLNFYTTGHCRDDKMNALVYLNLLNSVPTEYYIEMIEGYKEGNLDYAHAFVDMIANGMESISIIVDTDRLYYRLYKTIKNIIDKK